MRCAWLIGTTIPVMALAAVFFTDVPPKLVFNASQSAPIGFYLVADGSVNRGDFVLARVPEQVRNLIAKRGYLPPGVPMIKRVIGVEGDRVCREEQKILVNGVTVTVAKQADVLGRPLPDWQGCETLDNDRIFLLQEHTDSFDGRYFGPVDRRLIIGRATRWRPPWQSDREF